jgi:hypothetical protein
MYKLKKVTGTWRGTYNYAPTAILPNRESVRFTLALKQGWFGHFKGIVTDDSAHGMPGTGLIKGCFSFPRIEFIKRMPVCSVVTPEGRQMTLREFLIGQGISCRQELPHRPISYQGEFSSSTQAHGSWLLKGGSFPLGNGLVLNLEESKGTWTIENGAA